MPVIVVVAHAPLASALLAVAQHVYPDCARQLAAVDVGPGATPEGVAADIRAARAAYPEGETLILTDMFGATPCNGARGLADGTTVRVVAGVSVPMLWRTLCYGSLPLPDLVQRALDGGTQGVMHVPPEARRQNQSNPPGGHEQNNDPHQQ
jgi:PTS system ascorbate-specific IIA component